MSNKSLKKAKKAKNDEFYTQLTDVSEELRHYKKHFKGKTVFCNCDDPTWSAFWKYFHLNFEVLGLKKLISTHYDKNEPTYKMVYEGGDDNNIEVGVKTPLQGNGDFRNQECIDLLKESDIVVTNPPFSLFREYVAQLMEYGKKFIIIGSKNAITYKDFFPLLKDNKVWIGYNNVNDFQQPDGSFKKFGNIGWFTNLDIKKRHEKLIKELYKQYSPDEYPKYDNYDAINVNKVVDIPVDYDGVMGVPITFLDKYNPDEFEIIDARDYAINVKQRGKNTLLIKDLDSAINGKPTYARIAIRRKWLSVTICKTYLKGSNRKIMSSKNSNLHSAKNAKNDEFYTQLSDVSEELRHYKKHFKGKTVFCNCDDPTWSAFWKYFHLNFEVLGLKKLISTHYDKDKPTYKMVYEGGDDNDIEVGVKTPLQGNGDFRNQECIELLKESDIVVTNPPFSLFREYVAQLMECKKKFIIWGNNNAITYKEFFPLLKDNKVWLGYLSNKTCIFRVGENYRFDDKITSKINDGYKYGKVPAISVFTNLDIKKRHEKLVLWKTYTPEEYPTYDNYEAINVNKTVEIPSDYDGVMGVPISFLDKYNPNQFEIIGGFNGYKECDYENSLLCGSITEYIDKNGKIKKWTGPTVNKKPLYYRILIRKKHKK